MDADVVLQGRWLDERLSFRITVAEPGWRVFMVSHFHFDPVWYHSQAAYTETWAPGAWPRRVYEFAGLALVRAHLDAARQDPDYRFVLAELDYLKPYWGAFPGDREYIRTLLRDRRLELVGGMYNEPNTNLTAFESTIRNLAYGVAFQRDVMGGTPATAWLLDVFGHDPVFPDLARGAGLTSSSWARGPHHEWGPGRSMYFDKGDLGRMQFPSEFEWVSPSGRGLLTSYMPNHYSTGWWMDAAPTLGEAEVEALRNYRELRAVAATRNVLLPVGTDFTPPNRWITEIHRDWSKRYVWPKFLCATASEFFAAVADEARETGTAFIPQSRDMNPIFTGKDTSYIDTKQAQRQTENLLLGAERFATLAALDGAPYPHDEIDKAWRQLLFGAHHDGITGSESDQVYIDLLGSWAEAFDLAQESLDDALRSIERRIDTRGPGRPVVVFNPLSWSRRDIAAIELDLDQTGINSLELRDEDGELAPSVVEPLARHADGSWARVRVRFLCTTPGIGYSTWWIVPGAGSNGQEWIVEPGESAANERYVVRIDPNRGGAIASILDFKIGREIIRPGELANEVLVHDEYPDHPTLGHGPWIIGTKGPSDLLDGPSELSVERAISAVGERLIVRRRWTGLTITQRVTLWAGLDRIDLATDVDGFASQDVLMRVRFGAGVPGGRPISEVGAAVIGRAFGYPEVDAAEVPFSLDNPAYNWFGLGCTLRLEVDDGSVDGRRASRALGVCEIVAADPSSPSVRELVVALAQAGVTATVARHDGPRYGDIAVDSNVPDFRIAIGTPDQNTFVREILAQSDNGYSLEVRRQLAEGSCLLWVTTRETLTHPWRPNIDVSQPTDLPVLIVAGLDDDACKRAVRALVEQVAQARCIRVTQPAALIPEDEVADDYSVVVLNRGLPGYNVSPLGDLYLSLLRSSSGLPSGGWPDPPRRTAPDGSNFQFMHWSHRFEYALRAGAGDWRKIDAVRGGHEFNNPLVTRSVTAHPGSVPPTHALMSVRPDSAIVSSLKPRGYPLARGMSDRATNTVICRLYEAEGRPVRASVGGFNREPTHAFVTDLLEDLESDTPLRGGDVDVEIDGFGLATIGLTFDPIAADVDRRRDLLDPIFSRYWLHNVGAAPIGNQPLVVHLDQATVESNGDPFEIAATIASEYLDAVTAGEIVVLAPPDWKVDPPGRLFRLSPGGHSTFRATVTPSLEAAAGTYFLAIQVRDRDGRLHEDVATVRHRASADHESGPRLLMDPVTNLPVIVNGADLVSTSATSLVIDLMTAAIDAEPGETTTLRARISNQMAGEIRGEMRVISPFPTWTGFSPRVQAFVVGSLDSAEVAFRWTAPYVEHNVAYWALVKTTFFGQVRYSETVPISVRGHAPARR